MYSIDPQYRQKWMVILNPEIHVTNSTKGNVIIEGNVLLFASYL